MFQSLLAALKSRSARRVDARDRGLELAMDWDQDWHSPLGPRLRKELAIRVPAEAERLAAECTQAMQFGHALAFSLWKAGSSDPAGCEREFREQFAARYPWASAENIGRLFRQGLYYAAKTAAHVRPR